MYTCTHITCTHITCTHIHVDAILHSPTHKDYQYSLKCASHSLCIGANPVDDAVLVEVGHSLADDRSFLFSSHPHKVVGTPFIVIPLFRHLGGEKEEGDRRERGGEEEDDEREEGGREEGGREEGGREEGEGQRRGREREREKEEEERQRGGRGRREREREEG